MVTFSPISVLLLLPVALASTFEVEVGAEGSPGCNVASINGVVRGDVINFYFHPGNYTVAQLTSVDPCDLLCGGFDTRTINVPENATFKKSYFVPDDTAPLLFSCGEASDCKSRTILTINPDLPLRLDDVDEVVLQVRATGPSGLSSFNSATATLGSHNPGTFSGSIATAESVQEGPTGSVTDGLFSSPTPTLPGTASGSNSASSSASASGSSGKSSGAEATSSRMSKLFLSATMFVLGVSLA